MTLEEIKDAIGVNDLAFMFEPLMAQGDFSLDRKNELG
jgi:hypothetical protein